MRRISIKKGKGMSERKEKLASVIIEAGIIWCLRLVRARLQSPDPGPRKFTHGGRGQLSKGGNPHKFWKDGEQGATSQ